MTISRIELDNWQCHKHEAIDLDPFVSVFVGPSDTGKSAFLRALRWVACGKPLGEAFIRHGSKSCRVKVVVDGVSVSRERSGKSGFYDVGGRRSQAVGLSVPEEIQTAFNVGEETFQRQHDGPFLFDQTTGEVARHLNRVVALDAIDRALSNIGAAVRRAEANAELSHDRYRQAKAKRRELSWVPRMAADLERVEQSNTKYRETSETARTLRDLVQEGETLTEAVRACQKRSLALESVLETVSRAVSAGRDADNLAGLVREAKRLREGLCQARIERERAEKELAKVKTCPLCQQLLPARKSNAGESSGDRSKAGSSERVKAKTAG